MANLDDLSDAALDAALEEAGVATPTKDPVSEPEVEPPAVEEEEIAPEEELEEEVEEEEKPEEKPPSRREQLRVQQLLAKIKEQQAPAATVPRAPTDILDIQNDLEADEELKQRLLADRKAVQESAYRQGNEQAKSLMFHTRLEVDAPRMETKYPVLDKDAEKFNPVLANAVNTMFLDAVGYDPATDTVQRPQLRYSEYVESIFELAAEIAGQEVQQATKNIKKQAAQTGLRPGANTKPSLNLNKPAHLMTDEELDAVLAQAGLPSNPLNK